MGTKHSGIAEPATRGYLSGSVCPDPNWLGGRGIVVLGPQAHLSPLWVIEVAELPVVGVPMPPVIPPVPPPPEGALVFIDTLPDPFTNAREGGVPFVDEVPEVPEP